MQCEFSGKFSRRIKNLNRNFIHLLYVHIYYAKLQNFILLNSDKSYVILSETIQRCFFVKKIVKNRYRPSLYLRRYDRSPRNTAHAAEWVSRVHQPLKNFSVRNPRWRTYGRCTLEMLSARLCQTSQRSVIYAVALGTDIAIFQDGGHPKVSYASQCQIPSTTHT